MSDRKNVLVVCDDKLICDLTQQRLEKLGYTSVAIPSAAAARSIFPHNSDKFDLVMVDHVLFDGDGVDLVTEFLDISPDTPMVLYTGGAATIEDVPPSGMRAVIPKSATMQEFTEALENILA